MPRRPLVIRFWEKVEKRGPHECWLWTGHLTPAGYGRIWLDGRNAQATHVALAFDDIAVPPGMMACHHCDNPPCVNPAHLFVGTGSDNMLDCSRKGRLVDFNGQKKYCKRGHPFSHENTIVAASGYRKCRICTLASDERSRRKRGIKSAWRTHCVRGHEMAGDNLYFATEKSGKVRRQCKSCAVERKLEKLNGR